MTLGRSLDRSPSIRGPRVARGDGGQADSARVALINMPFALVDRPSIQCGLLKAALMAHGHRADVHYFNLDLAATIGPAAYLPLSRLRANILIGEWLFSAAAFGTDIEEDKYVGVRPALTSFCDEVGITFDELRRARLQTLPEWIAQCATSVTWSDYTVVGFTSTFEQNNASFALAKAIKAASPSVPIVFGGANFDGDMGKEYVRALPFIDYAVIGEGDLVFPEMVARIARGLDPIGLRGVVGRAGGSVVGEYPASVVTDMDAVPDPDYDDYFERLARLGTTAVYGTDASPLILFESSRGCWWGQKQHCTFCGLNANGMTYRAKSAANAIEQLRRLSTRHQLVHFEAVDNILDYRYIDQVCAPLARERLDFRFFYEVKANLKREQLRTMAEAGIREIQPGIESLSSHVLTLMRKGTTMLHNIRCLKWSMYYGIRVYWNILTGFPGETEDDYRTQAEVLPLLRHLQPPTNCGRIWLERFSPYFFDDVFPIKNVRPLEAYRFAYPGSSLDLDAIAYFFEYDMAGTLPDEFHVDLHGAIASWKDAWSASTKPTLAYQRAPGWIRIIDTRGGERERTVFEGIAAAVYEACTETDRTVGQLHEALATQKGGPVAAEQIQTVLDAFCAKGYAICDSGKYFSLALPLNRTW